MERSPIANDAFDLARSGSKTALALYDAKFAAKQMLTKGKINLTELDANAASKFSRSNSGNVWTAQIKVDGKLLGLDGNFCKNSSNLTHIPVMGGGQIMQDYYQNLPDYLSTDELKVEFNNFIKSIEAIEYDLLDALQSLIELADRQWHTYKLIDEMLKEKIEDWLIRVIDFNSEEIIEYETSVIGRLGLSKLFSLTKDALLSDLKKEIRQIIEETIAEIGDHVKDPYHGMRS